MANNNHFTLELDTLAPTGSISRGDSQFVKENFSLTIVKGDASYMYVWFDTTDKPTVIPDNVDPIPATTSYTTTFAIADPGQYYYHLVLMDDLNNKSKIYSTDPIIFDTTKPVVGSVTLNDGAAITKSRTVTVEFTFTDAAPSSGCVSYALSGNLAASTVKTGTFSAEEIKAGKAKREILLDGTGNEDTTKTVSVTVTDASGNTSDPVSDTIILDTEFLTGSIVIRDKADSKTINSTWVNYQDIIVQLQLNEGLEKDCVGYKIWGDVNTSGDATVTTEPVDYTSNPEGQDIAVTMKLTSGDAAAKNIYAKVIDDAGNETTLTSVFVKYDATAPSVSIEAATETPGFVSEVTGFNTVTITPTVDASISNVASYVLLLDDKPTTKTGTNAVPDTITFAAADMGAAGAHTFKLKVTDNAGNTTTSAAVTITKDTTGPVGTIVMSGWANKSTYPTLGVKASATDSTTTVAFMECWVSSTAKDTVVPSGTTKLAYAENPIHGQVNWTAKAESATNYIHIRYTDSVGNTSIAHSGAFGVDTIAPDIGHITFSKPAYDTVNGSVTISSSDATSKLDKMMLTGPIEGSGTWEAYATTRNVVFTGEDGNKTVTIKFKDVAGNESEGPDASATAELDRVYPSLSITMLEDDDTTIKPAISNRGSFILHFTGHDDKGEPVSAKDLEYKVYGDFNTTADQLQGITEPEEWTQVVFETGKDYVKTPVYYATKDTSSTGDGTLKTIYVRVRDNAGNVTDKTVTFTYDTSAPEVTVSDIDFNRISTVQELRFHDVSGNISEIAGKYADEINFTFTPSTAIQAYQVCAYVDADAAKAGDHTTGKIGIANGSANMAATGLNSNAAVSCMIKGEDYKDVVVTDGAHIVVVYVQDLGGTWSVAASFSA